ncbi:response regulator [Maribacter sp. TH_r10]|uniref:Response regulator n=1 Tax=Maribacter luteus TaxID=2594478 RepID=A0A6I2MUF6_9FLAO|nr:MULTISPECIES: response regulator [Maribacter]MDV7138428.1 response regulator [Maribacter sp. TH_r10]MRX66200.1 response regulator [Maribacter luteus]|tara:strand:+ start:343 stop:1395 length:1053 start_codon:yes stop_codon:yes gene_type:complete
MNKVLLIEDDPVLRENTAELLELSDYKVYTASNGKKGVNVAKEKLPDVIICDIMMPELDGYGVLEQLGKDIDTKYIPFIFLSAKTERKDIRKGMNLGADDYLTKPFEESELISAIESRLARAAILQEIKSSESEHGHASGLEVRNIHEFKNYLDDNGQEFEFAQGDEIYREGGNVHMVYLIIKGVVKTYKLDENGKELITAIYNADEFFGFTSLTSQEVYEEYAVAIEDTVLVGVCKDELRTVVKENHDLAIELMHVLAENLTEAKKQLLEMAYGSVRKKTASTLLKFADKLEQDNQGNIHILRSDLASVAGMATETLIRTLSSFRKEGLIAMEDHNIKILDQETLSRIY